MGDDEEGEGEPMYKMFEKGSTDPRPDGSRYFGGEGRAEFINGDRFDGTFSNGQRQGKGRYTFAKNGDMYEGVYELDKRHGFGQFVYGSKKSEDDEDAGGDEGESAVPRGGKYLGFFSDGKRGCKEDQDPNATNSSGSFTYVNGDVYVGQWRAGKKHGSGTYSYAKDETQLIGEWENGKIVHGRWVFPNGTFYSGAFRYNKPFGKGVWVFKNGNQVTGEYTQKELNTEDGDAGDPEDGAPKKDPEVACVFKHGGNVVVRGGTMFDRAAYA